VITPETMFEPQISGEMGTFQKRAQA